MRREGFLTFFLVSGKKEYLKNLFVSFSDIESEYGQAGLLKQLSSVELIFPKIE